MNDTHAVVFYAVLVVSSFCSIFFPPFLVYNRCLELCITLNIRLSHPSGFLLEIIRNGALAFTIALAFIITLTFTIG